MYIQKLVWYIRICSTRRTLRLCYRSTRLHIVCVCKVRQGPRHKHHCGNEHDEHSFREFHTSKNLSVRNRRTSSMGRANQTCFAPKGLEICPFCRKNKLVSATSLFRLTDVFSSGFPKSEFPKPDSPKSRGPRESAAECVAFPLGISPSITERGVLSRKVCQICRTSTLPTGVPSYNMPESYRLPSVCPLRCGCGSEHSIPYRPYPVNHFPPFSRISPFFTNPAHSLCTNRIRLQM